MALFYGDLGRVPADRFEDLVVFAEIKLHPLHRPRGVVVPVALEVEKQDVVDEVPLARPVVSAGFGKWRDVRLT